VDLNVGKEVACSQVSPGHLAAGYLGERTPFLQVCVYRVRQASNCLQSAAEELGGPLGGSWGHGCATHSGMIFVRAKRFSCRLVRLCPQSYWGRLFPWNLDEYPVIISPNAPSTELPRLP